MQTKKFESYRIRGYLRKLGIPTHVKGFKYLAEAIYMVYLDEELINCIAKEVYSEIADKYGTSVACVERDIRFAVAGAWKCSRYEEKKPTNKQYISSVLNMIKTEGVIA